MIAHHSSIETLPKRRKQVSSRVVLAGMLVVIVCGVIGVPWATADQVPGITASMERVATMRNLLAHVQAVYPGQVLEVELDREKYGKNELWIYEVKLLTQKGSVLKLEYDAVSLELLDIEGKVDN